MTEATPSPAASQAGIEWAQSLRANDFFEVHCARRLRAFDADSESCEESPLPDALGNGLALLNLLDPNGSRYQRTRTHVESIALWCTGEAYPTMAQVEGFVLGAQEALRHLDIGQ